MINTAVRKTQHFLSSAVQSERSRIYEHICMRIASIIQTIEITMWIVKWETNIEFKEDTISMNQEVYKIVKYVIAYVFLKCYKKNIVLQYI